MGGAVHIYALVDPRTDKVRYVGKTIQTLGLRLTEHTVHAFRHPDSGPKTRWICELRSLGLKPKIKLLDTVLEFFWKEAERAWGGKFKNLLNDRSRFGLGCTRSYVVTWTPQLDARLGKEADAIIAEDLGVTRKAVTYRRKVLGIAPSFDQSRMKSPPPMGGHNQHQFPKAILDRIGKEPDYVLGDEIGVQKSVIARYRRRHGIPSYAKTTGKTGTFAKGNFPARWLHRPTVNSPAICSPQL